MGRGVEGVRSIFIPDKSFSASERNGLMSDDHPTSGTPAQEVFDRHSVGFFEGRPAEDISSGSYFVQVGGDRGMEQRNAGGGCTAVNQGIGFPLRTPHTDRHGRSPMSKEKFSSSK